MTWRCDQLEKEFFGEVLQGLLYRATQRHAQNTTLAEGFDSWLNNWTRRTLLLYKGQGWLIYAGFQLVANICQSCHLAHECGVLSYTQCCNVTGGEFEYDKHELKLRTKS